MHASSFYCAYIFILIVQVEVLFVAAVPVAAADLQTLSESQLQTLCHLVAGLVESILCGER